MKKIKNLRHNNLIRFLLLIVGDASVIIFYFTYFIRHYTEKYEDLQQRQIALIMTGVILAFAVFFYTLIMLDDFFYDEGSKRIVIRTNLTKAYKYMKLLRIFDILRLYKNQYFVFLTIYYRDFNLTDELDNVLQNKIFKKDLSMELVYNYNKFIVSINRNIPEDVDKYYSLLIDTYESSIGVKKEISLVYSLNMIKAEYNLYIKEYNKVYRCLANIDKEKFNHRELAYYYYMYSLYYKNVKQESKSLNYFERGRKLHPNAYFYSSKI